jgi:hypothetical protein
MVSMASRALSQVASCDALVQAIGSGVGAGVGVGVAVTVGAGVALGSRDGVMDGGLKGAGDDRRLRIGDDLGALASTAVAQPVPINTTSTRIVALGLPRTTTQRVTRWLR